MYIFIIKKVDKGSSVVIQNREDYLKEGFHQLSDTQFYWKTDRNLTLEHNARVESKVRSMVDSGDISIKTAEYLITKQPRTAQFYLLPKIHKRLRDPPGRPILSANECPTERIS